MIVSEAEWKASEPERRRASEGDPLAWESLFTWLWPWTVQLAGSEDGAMRGWEKIIVRPSLWLKELSYFATVFKNAGRDEDRAHRRQGTIVRELGASLGRGAHRPFDDASATLRWAIGKLSPDNQKLLELYLKGHSLEEISKRTGTAYGTLRRRIRAAVIALREILNGGEGLTPAA